MDMTVSYSFIISIPPLLLFPYLLFDNPSTLLLFPYLLFDNPSTNNKRVDGLSKRKYGNNKRGGMEIIKE
jgi:hypothetical protein